MKKNWLIRTQSKAILGPVTRDKVFELIRNGSLKEDDELCSGNGYWFLVSESDHVDLYLEQQQKQPFNPVSEAQNILTANDTDESIATVDHGLEKKNENKEFILERNDSSSVDITQVNTDINALLNDSEKENKGDKDDINLYPEDSDLEYPEVDQADIIVKKSKTLNVASGQKREVKLRGPALKRRGPQISIMTDDEKNSRSDSRLAYLLIIILILLIAVSYFLKTNVVKMFESSSRHLFIGNAIAQIDYDSLKKKR